eukprot:g8342.t1
MEEGSREGGVDCEYQMGDEPNTQQIHLCCWNVAGWLTSVKFIKRYNNSLEEWLRKHAIDILCLQEVKTTAKKLTDEPAVHGANTPGYDTFWATCESKPYKGFNGVATFARQGLTLSADAHVMREDPELDAEGRSGKSRLPFQLRFLRRLRACMQEERRRTNKPVLLVGDLNMTYRIEDRFWEHLAIDVPSLLRSSSTLQTTGERLVGAPSTAVDMLSAWLKTHWPAVETMLATREAKPFQSKTSTGMVDKWRLWAVGHGNTKVLLGSPSTTQEAAFHSYSLDGHTVRDELTAEALEAWPDGHICMGQLKELLDKAVGQRWGGTSGAPWRISSNSPPPKASPPLPRPANTGFALCWRRMTWWTRSLHCGLMRSAGSAAGTSTGTGDISMKGLALTTHWSTACSSRRWWQVVIWRQASATAGGLFKAAPFSGGGIGVLEPPAAAFSVQFRPPHTDFIYFPLPF